MEVRAFGDPSALSGGETIDVMLLEGERTADQRAFKGLIEQALRDEGYTVVPRGTGAIHALASAGVNNESPTAPRDRWVAVVVVMRGQDIDHPLFQGRVVAADRCGSLGDVGPALVGAIFETFPDLGYREVTVPDDPTRCRSVVSPAAP
jgi:hypothetical protein